MTEAGTTPANSTKKSSMTAKAIIHQKFGDKACYKVEEVHDSTQNGCPGLAIPQKGPCLYRCTLHLPEDTFVSDTFRRKKDAEQSAAEKAIEKVFQCIPYFLFLLVKFYIVAFYYPSKKVMVYDVMVLLSCLLLPCFL